MLSVSDGLPCVHAKVFQGIKREGERSTNGTAARTYKRKINGGVKYPESCAHGEKKDQITVTS